MTLEETPPPVPHEFTVSLDATFIQVREPRLMEQASIDYRALLVAFMRETLRSETVVFVGRAEYSDAFTDAQKAAVRSCYEESRK